MFGRRPIITSVKTLTRHLTEGTEKGTKNLSSCPCWSSRKWNFQKSFGACLRAVEQREVPSFLPEIEHRLLGRPAPYPVCIPIEVSGTSAKENCVSTLSDN
jgi:hypothetical protein